MEHDLPPDRLEAIRARQDLPPDRLHTIRTWDLPIERLVALFAEAGRAVPAATDHPDQAHGADTDAAPRRRAG